LVHLEIPGTFHNHGNMVRFIFHTGDLIFVQCGTQGMFVDTALFNKILSFFFCRGTVYLNDSKLSLRTILNPAVNQIITSEHDTEFSCFKIDPLPIMRAAQMDPELYRRETVLLRAMRAGFSLFSSSCKAEKYDPTRFHAIGVQGPR
jgi:hypothetical protein